MSSQVKLLTEMDLFRRSQSAFVTHWMVRINQTFNLHNFTLTLLSWLHTIVRVFTSNSSLAYSVQASHHSSFSSLHGQCV